MRSLLIASLLLFLASVGSATAVGDSSPPLAPLHSVSSLCDIPATTWSQAQLYEGQRVEFNWYLNPCQLGNQQGTCGTAGFLQQFGYGGSCQMTMGNLVQFWHGDATAGYTALLADSNGRREARITITCDVFAGNLAPAPNTDVVVTSTSFGYLYEMQLVSSRVCGSGDESSSSTTSSGGSSEGHTCSSGTDSPAVEPTVYRQDQVYQGQATPYDWFFSPCLPSASGTCFPEDGYLQQFSIPSQGSQCQTSFSQVLHAWAYFEASAWTPSGYSGKFTNSFGDRIADITVWCNETAGNLSPAGVAQANGGDGRIIWTIYLNSARACKGAPPVTPIPTSPLDGCSQFSSSGCAGCTKAPSGNCGYCLQTKTCQQGTSNGAANGNCPIDDWEWYPDECQDEGHH